MKTEEVKNSEQESKLWLSSIKKGFIDYDSSQGKVVRQLVAGSALVSIAISLGVYATAFLVSVAYGILVAASIALTLGLYVLAYVMAVHFGKLILLIRVRSSDRQFFKLVLPASGAMFAMMIATTMRIGFLGLEYGNGQDGKLLLYASLGVATIMAGGIISAALEILAFLADSVLNAAAYVMRMEASESKEPE